MAKPPRRRSSWIINWDAIAPHVWNLDLAKESFRKRDESQPEPIDPKQILDALIAHQRSYPKLPPKRLACRTVAGKLGVTVTIEQVEAAYDNDLPEELKSKQKRGRPSKK